MNRYEFALRNFSDKLFKISKNPEMLKYYWHTYVVGSVKCAIPDAFIVSYPKCGRTWLRVLFQNYFEDIGINLLPSKDRFLFEISDGRAIKFDHDQGNWVPAPLRIDQLSFDEAKYKNKLVVYLTRDPRDVVVSSWYHLKYRERIYKGDLSTFIRDDLVGIKKVVAFMNMWMTHLCIPEKFLLVTYEEMHANTVSVFSRILDFLGFEASLNQLQRVVNQSSFKKMKRMEVNGDFNEPWIKPGFTAVEESMKIRKGKIGSYNEELSDQDIEYLNVFIKKNLSSHLPYVRQ